jgi:glutaredoxin 3
MQVNSIVYSQDNCPACRTAKALLLQRGYSVEERKIGGGWTKKDLLDKFPDARTVPQIIVGDELIGTLDKLKDFLAV